MEIAPYALENRFHQRRCAMLAYNGLSCIGLMALLTAPVFAGGELSISHTEKTTITNTAPVEKHYTAVEDVCAAVERQRTKYSRLTMPIPLGKDPYGDPMYVAYGPRPYAGSPMYNG